MRTLSRPLLALSLGADPPAQGGLRKKLGPAYSECRFHDELLAAGSIPFVFARAKLLGAAVPAI